MKLFAFEKSVGAVVFRIENGEGKYLLLLSDHWDFPKGHLEKGEKEEETLKREVLEETGIDEVSVVAGFKKSIFYSYATGKEERERKGGIKKIFKRVVFYLAETGASEVVLSKERKFFEWLGHEEAVKRLTYDKGRNILRKAEEFLGK